MAAEIVLLKTPGGALVPVDDEGRELISKLKMGQGVKAKIVRARNPQFHRLVFSLLQLAFEAWNPPEVEYRGEPVVKNFDTFRRNLTVLAGFHETTVNLKGEIRLEAKSLSYANMDQSDFEQVYKALLDVVWSRVLKHVAGYATPEAVDAVVQRLLAYDQ